MSSSDKKPEVPGIQAKGGHDQGGPDQGGNVSRRGFLKGTGLVLSVPLVAGSQSIRVNGAEVKVHGPNKVPITLTVNGAKKTVNVEPRVTLLDALRNDLDITGAKRVCDRATCGACTMIVDGKAIYGCTMLAIEAQGRAIRTVESLEQGGKLHPVQQAFVDHDGQQCGFCTPGFVMACTALLEKHPNPTPDQVTRGLGGNLCRCGTYVGIRAAVVQAAKQMPATKGGKRNG